MKLCHEFCVRVTSRLFNEMFHNNSNLILIPRENRAQETQSHIPAALSSRGWFPNMANRYSIIPSRASMQGMCAPSQKICASLRMVRGHTPATYLHQGKVVCLLDSDNVETCEMCALLTKIQNRNNFEHERTLNHFGPTVFCLQMLHRKRTHFSIVFGHLGGKLL